MMKKIFYPVITALFLASAFSVSASAAEWRKETKEEITDGVFYKRIMSYDGGAFSLLHVIECDTKNPAASLGVMTAEAGASYLETTKAMAEKNNAIAAVNGDFFNTGSKRTNMLGVVYQDGELISTPSKDVWATLALTETGNILMDYFGFSGKVTAPAGASYELYQINKMPSTLGAVNMFTPNWGATVTLAENMHALLIKDGIVTARITVPGEVAFGDNDTILAVNHSINPFLDNFSVGERVTIEYSLTGTNEKIAEAVGANTLIVADGQRASFTHDTGGTAQRTAAGINKDGTKLYLVVAEGRQTVYKGFTQKGFADALIELGCYRAVNLDGGGSSTIVTRDEISGNVSIRNNLSSQRSVSTSLGLFNKLPKSGDIVKGVCKPADKTVFSGDSIEIYYTFYDSNSHTVNGMAVTVESSNPNDAVSGQNVQFNGGGARTVSVTAEGVTASAEVYVIEEVASAEIYPANLTVAEGGEGTVSVTVWDSEGRRAYPRNINWISSGVTVNNGRVSSGTGYIGADFGAVKVFCGVNGGEAPANVFSKNKFMETSREGTHIRISAGSKQYSTIADMIRVLNFEYSLAGADYLYMLNTPLVKDISYISPDTFSQRAIDNTLIMTINSSSGSIKTANQLAEIMKLKNIAEKNLIIITEKSPSALHETERELFLESLKSASEAGKNIFVVYEEATSQSYTENGVWFIGCKPNRGADDSDGRTVDFYISGDSISYTL